MTLTLAIVGAVTGVLSLAWQCFIFLGSGPRVELTTCLTFPPREGADWQVVLIATNKGRAATTITGWGVTFKRGPMKEMALAAINEFSTPLPHRLESHARVMHAIPRETVRSWTNADGLRWDEMRPFVMVLDKRVYCDLGMPTLD